MFVCLTRSLTQKHTSHSAPFCGAQINPRSAFQKLTLTTVLVWQITSRNKGTEKRIFNQLLTIMI